MTTSLFVAERVGLVALVDKGYGALAWLFIVTFLIPLLTYGVWRIARTHPSLSEKPAHEL